MEIDMKCILPKGRTFEQNQALKKQNKMMYDANIIGHFFALNKVFYAYLCKSFFNFLK